MPNVCSAGADRNAGMVQCIPNTSAPSTKSQNWDGTFWCPACGVMLRLVGDTSFQTWWQCGDCNRTEGDPGATTLPDVRDHDHRSAVYQVLPEFRDLFEFAIGWSDIPEDGATETSAAAQALLVDEAAERNDDNDYYEQVDINSLLDPQLELGNLGSQQASRPLEASEEAQPESSAEKDDLAELVRALCSPGEPSEIFAQEMSVASPPEVPDVQMPKPENGSESQPSPTDDSLECVKPPVDAEPSVDSAECVNATTAAEPSVDSAECVNATTAAEPANDGSLATSVAYGDGQAYEQGLAAATRRRDRAGEGPVRTSLPPPAELISYAPLTRDALWIPPQHKPRSRHTGMALGLSAALMGIVALMGYREVGSLGVQLYGTAMRNSREQTAIKSFASLRVPPPTPVAFDLLLPKPTIEVPSAKVPTVEDLELVTTESVDATTASESSGPSSAQSVKLTIAASYVPVQKVAQGSSVGAPARQEVAKVRSDPPKVDEPSVPITAKFDANMAETAITGAAERANACRDATTPKGAAVVSITFAPSGRVITTSVSGPPFAGTSAGSCIASTLYGIRVPPFAGTESVTLTRTLSIR